MTPIARPHTNLPHRHSIRWQLPFSYAGIALLTALALAGVLLYALNGYYDQRERDYLELTARTLGRQTERMYDDQLSDEAIQSSVTLLSFLAQARVRLLNLDEQVVVDSGPYTEPTQINVSFIRGELAGVQPGEPGDGGGNNDGGFVPYLSVWQDAPPAPPQDAPLAQAYRYPFTVQRGAFGQFVADGDRPGERSTQQVIVPITNANHEPLGYLELSEGPAFGNEIVSDVAEKGILAGVIAVLFAALMGWVVSRQISQPVLALADTTRRMAEGDLSVRVNLKRRDELGLLAEMFNTMAERVENTVNALKRFVADAAHEINTPITALRTNLELAASGQSPADFQADITRAQIEVERLETLTRGLLTLSRLEAHGVQAVFEPVDLAALARQMIEHYASRAEQSGIALQIEASSSALIVRADERQITRVLENLLDNALKFTPSGGRVTLRLAATRDGVRLSVADTGIGIPAEDLPKLFSRFHRGRNTAAYPGNGLGLVLAKTIVEDHGGRILVASSADGTRFDVDLPRDSRERWKQ